MFPIKFNGKKPYNDFEMRILFALKSGAKLTDELREAAYKDLEIPTYASGALNVRLKRLKKKVDVNKESFRLAHSNRTGGAVRLAWWIEDRHGK